MSGLLAHDPSAARELAGWLDAEKRAVDEWLISRLEIEQGDLILETACGAGGPGLTLASLVGENGRVICSDRSPAMLESAQQVAQARGVTAVEFRLLDAQRLELPDESVDGVLCRLGFHEMHDPESAFSEAYRVLRPGGSVALSVWSERERNRWQSIPEDVLQFVWPATGRFAAGPFALADEDLLRSLLMDARFVDVQVSRVRADQRYESAEHLWSIFMRKAPELRDAFLTLNACQQVAAKSEILDRLSKSSLSEGDGLLIGAEMLVAKGRRDA